MPSSTQRLTDEQIEAANAAELRAVASDRGYDLQHGGGTMTRARFKQLQEEDEGLEDQEEAEEEATPRYPRGTSVAYAGKQQIVGHGQSRPATEPTDAGEAGEGFEEE